MAVFNSYVELPEGIYPFTWSWVWRLVLELRLSSSNSYQDGHSPLGGSNESEVVGSPCSAWIIPVVASKPSHEPLSYHKSLQISDISMKSPSPCCLSHHVFPWFWSLFRGMIFPPWHSTPPPWTAGDEKCPQPHWGPSPVAPGSPGGFLKKSS